MDADRALDPDGQHPDWSQLLAARWALRAGTYRSGQHAKRIACRFWSSRATRINAALHS